MASPRSEQSGGDASWSGGDRVSSEIDDDQAGHRAQRFTRGGQGAPTEGEIWSLMGID